MARQGQGASVSGAWGRATWTQEVWESDAEFHFGYPTQNQLLSQNRKQRKNHTGKLHELALLLPVALKTGSKKLTKKEILLHVLHYIQYLQRSIDVAQALLKLHTTDGEGGLGGLGQNPTVGPARRRHSTPSSSPHSLKSCLQGACRKPQKKKLTRGLGTSYQWRQSRKWGSKGRGSFSRAVILLGGLVSNPEPLTKLQSLTYLVTQWGHRSPRVTAMPSPGLRVCLLNSTSCRQKPVFYDSSEEVDQESPDADPWLPAWTPEGSPHGSPLALGPLQIDNWSVTGLPREILGLSPSLFSSPEKLLPEKILEDGDEYLTQGERPGLGLMLGSFRKHTVMPLNLSQSSVLQDHCYLSLSENSKGPSSPSSEDSDPNTDTESVWKPPEADPKGPQSSSEEDGDYTWTPTRRASTLPAARRRTRKGPASGCPVKSEKTAPCPIQTKKKCVNGFIMFCRMNRKQYIRSCPGTASTAATKELAQLWRLMSEQERKPYSIKARRFSRRHNRIVKQESSSSEDEDWGTPKPFYQLLAEKARCSSKPAPLPPRRRK
uniref:Meiosis initiator n=1 Tax=Rhinolophus ferrumequinum TaxID=59479 RepID=A0A671ENW0_RHIFE